jgi:deazaflavin-dependent oxidoreductase (nitroreductase family)
MALGPAKRMSVLSTNSLPAPRTRPLIAEIVTAGTLLRRSRLSEIGGSPAAPLDRKLLQRSLGRFTILGPIGAPTVLLTTTGRKSGQPRTNPLLYIRDNGRLVVVGSNFGHSTHPAWTANLLAVPNGTVTLGSTIVPVVATPIDGTEYEDLYTAFVNMASVYGGYRQRTDRTMRMFALTPQ